MSNYAKQFIKRNFGRQLASFFKARSERIDRRGIASFGQEGEDRILASLLFKLHGGLLPLKGFYVDVGAHDPFRFSNTFFFYKRGWVGINIDAAPGSMRRFSRYRPRDLNLEIGIGREVSSAVFYLMSEPALNTFDVELAKARCIPPWSIVGEATVAILPLRDVFEKYLSPGQAIDFITIDVEGRDFEVLDSNDWSLYRPLIVVVEIFGRSVEEALEDPVAKYLDNCDYVFYSKSVNTAFFADRKRVPTVNLPKA